MSSRDIPRVLSPDEGKRHRLVTQRNRRYSIFARLTSHVVSRLTHHRTDVQLDGVEFSALPSGLHLLERDVVYVRRNRPSPLKLDGSSLTPPLHIPPSTTQLLHHQGLPARRLCLSPAPDLRGGPTRLPSLLPWHPPRALGAPAPLATPRRAQGARARDIRLAQAGGSARAAGGRLGASAAVLR